jgi:hypothetical protein
MVPPSLEDEGPKVNPADRRGYLPRRTPALRAERSNTFPSGLIYHNLKKIVKFNLATFPPRRRRSLAKATAVSYNEGSVQWMDIYLG